MQENVTVVGMDAVLGAGESGRSALPGLIEVDDDVSSSRWVVNHGSTCELALPATVGALHVRLERTAKTFVPKGIPVMQMIWGGQIIGICK